MSENAQHTQKGEFKQQFVFGLVTGIAVVSLIGFITVLVRGGSAPKVAGEAVGDPSALTVQEEQQAEIVLAEVTQEDHILGPIDAPVKIVEHTDLECPFCKRNHATMKQIKEEYGEDVAWVVRHFPLSQLHSKAPKEAEATECAAELGGEDAFFALVDKIFEVSPTNNGLDLETLPDLAGVVGLDKAKFKECLDSGKYADKVEKSYQGAVAAGGQGTPYNVIIGPDGQKVPLAGAYPIENFKEVINAMLASQ